MSNSSMSGVSSITINYINYNLIEWMEKNKIAKIDSQKNQQQFSNKFFVLG